MRVGLVYSSFCFHLCRMSIAKNLSQLKASLPGHVTLVAVSKTHPAASIREAYDSGHRNFGENKVQEMAAKAAELPADICWHLIGHLQTNKVKYIAEFVHLIHSVDSPKLLHEINKQAQKTGRVIKCLLQVHIASESTKFGLTPEEAEAMLGSNELAGMQHVCITGLMGMATFTDNETQVREEFRSLHDMFTDWQKRFAHIPQWQPAVLSMGMSSDYTVAIEEGSNMVRVGSAIFGQRDYTLKP